MLLEALLNNLNRAVLTELFGNKIIKTVEDKLTEKNGKTYVSCLVRNKEVIAKPEELYPNDFAQFVDWIAPVDVQQSIRKAVDDAFTAKGNATRLLDAAKRAVEIAIEESEAAALAYLEAINP